MEEGFMIAAAPDAADVIIVNTCGFIDDAKRESIAAILDMAEYKKDGKRLVVSGCLSQRYGEDLAGELPEVDRFIGVHDYGKLPKILRELLDNGQEAEGANTAEVQFGGETAGETGAANAKPRAEGANTGVLQLRRKRLEPVYSAYLKASDGCNNRCSYCVIPFIRGPYSSRPENEIVSECEGLVAGGAREIVLIAQDLTAYGYDLHGRFTLPALVRRLCGIEGADWIRLMYCYEDRVSDELIEVIRSEEKVCNYIDMPLQHISDRILTSMRRRSTQKSILNTISRLRTAIPDIAIRTTLITGFPGETDEDFNELLDFVTETKFERLGVFAYSQEEGTPAAEMKNQIDEEVKQARLEALMLAQQGISLEKNRAKIGKVLEVLVEEKDADGSFIGRTRYDAPEIDNGVIFSAGRGLTGSRLSGLDSAAADIKPASLTEPRLSGLASAAADIKPANLTEPRPGDIVMVKINDAFDYDIAGERFI
jgi:ribosomal protein S12 methylthiotransferase